MAGGGARPLFNGRKRRKSLAEIRPWRVNIRGCECLTGNPGIVVIQRPDLPAETCGIISDTSTHSNCRLATPWCVRQTDSGRKVPVLSLYSSRAVHCDTGQQDVSR